MTTTHEDVIARLVEALTMITTNPDHVLLPNERELARKALLAAQDEEDEIERARRLAA